MDRFARLGGLALVAIVALGCGGGGGIKYAAKTIDFDAHADAPAETAPVTRPTDAASETAADAAADKTVRDASPDLGPCPFGGAVPIYCSGDPASVYEPSPLIACIGGGHVYGMCAQGCTAGMIMGPVADPLALLCAGADGGVDGDAGD